RKKHKIAEKVESEEKKSLEAYISNRDDDEPEGAQDHLLYDIHGSEEEDEDNNDEEEEEKKNYKEEAEDQGKGVREE
ncbi:hypothetical protein KI387_029680, partial [Taxus chinensis]